MLPDAHQASSRDSWVALRNRTSIVAPPFSVEVSTQNPLLGVAQFSATELSLQLNWVVPPTRVKVRVLVVCCGGGGVGAGDLGGGAEVGVAMGA